MQLLLITLSSFQKSLIYLSLQILNMLSIFILSNQNNRMMLAMHKHTQSLTILIKKIYIVVSNPYFQILLKIIHTDLLLIITMLIYKILAKPLPILQIKSCSLSAIRTRLINNKSSQYFSTVQQYDPKTDYYKKLNVTQSASASEIKQSFYQMAKKYHPDSHPGYQEQFKAVNQAHNVLSNEQLKKQYDAARYNFNIGQQSQKFRQQSTNSYYHKSQSNWAYVRRGKTYQYENPDGSYFRKTYGYRNAGTYGERDQAFQMARKFRMFQQANFHDELRSHMAFSKQRQFLQRIQMQRNFQMKRIIRQMQKQYQQRQNKAFQSSLIYRITTYIWNKSIETYVSIKNFLNISKK